MNNAPRIASFDSVPTLNRALKHSISRSLFDFFAAGGADVESVSGAGVEPVDEEVVVSSSLSRTSLPRFRRLTIVENENERWVSVLQEVCAAFIHFPEGRRRVHAVGPLEREVLSLSTRRQWSRIVVPRSLTNYSQNRSRLFDTINDDQEDQFRLEHRYPTKMTRQWR